MNEVVTEQVQKEQTDRQWDRYYRQKDDGNAQVQKPSEKQKTYIVQLGRRVGLKIDLSRVDSREAASRLIDQLRQLHGRMNGNGQQSTNELRDKRVAFGMATKLVYRKWVDLHHTPGKSKRFWKEVTELFEEYEKQQEVAVCSFTSASELAAVR